MALFMMGKEYDGMDIVEGERQGFWHLRQEKNVCRIEVRTLRSHSG